MGFCCEMLPLGEILTIEKQSRRFFLLPFMKIYVCVGLKAICMRYCWMLLLCECCYDKNIDFYGCRRNLSVEFKLWCERIAAINSLSFWVKKIVRARKDIIGIRDGNKEDTNFRCFPSQSSTHITMRGSNFFFFLLVLAFHIILRLIDHFHLKITTACPYRLVAFAYRAKIS